MALFGARRAVVDAEELGSRWTPSCSAGATLRPRVGVIALVLALVLVAGGCDWQQLWFGPDRRNYNPSESALTESTIGHLSVRWSKACACSQPLVAGANAYVLEGTTLRALHVDTGSEAWSTVVGPDFSLVAVANGLVYLTNEPAAAPHQLVGRDAGTGAARFATPLTSGSGDAQLIDDVLVDGDLAFVAATVGSESSVTAIDTAGGVRWRATPGGRGSRLVANPGKTIYIGTSIFVTTTGSQEASNIPLLTGYGEADGVLQSGVRPQVCCEGASPIAFDDGLIFSYESGAHGAMGHGLSAIDPDTGRVVWGDGVYERPIVFTPNVVIAEDGPYLAAFDARTGRFLWDLLDFDHVYAPAIGVGDLLLRYYGDTVEVRRLSDGHVVTTFVPVPGESIGLLPSGGRVYVSTSTHLIALSPTA